MTVDFDSKKLRELCEKSAVAQKQLGKDVARKLRARLADLNAALRLGDLVLGSPHPLTADRSGQFAISLAGGNRLVVEPLADPPPLTPGGAIDWHAVDSVRVVFIGDYHD